MKLIIKGVPMQKQSARFANRKGFMIKYQPKKLNDWVAQARMQILDQLAPEHRPFDCLLSVSVLFVFPPLKGWTKAKKENLRIYESVMLEVTEGMLNPEYSLPPIYKESKPDLDNLEKAIFDVCNGLVWLDDVKIVEISNVKKIYGSVPRIEMIISEVE